jgi:hypothetical protein
VTDYNVGDVARVFTTIRDVAGNLVDATVAITVQHPDLSETTPVVAHDSLGRYHADFAIDAAGVWRWEFAATGAVSETEEGALVAKVRWTQALPWAPSLRQVAGYVPTRTVPVDTPGSMTPLGTFDATTVPNDEAVSQIAQDAAAWVAANAGAEIDPALYDMASSTAAVRAAAFVELAYPTRDWDASVYEALLKQANDMLAELRTANASAGETTPGAGALLPVGSFPDVYVDLDVWSWWL